MATLQELLAQQAALNLALAGHEKPLVEQAAAALAAESVATLVADLTAIRDELPAGVAQEQIGNVVIVLTSVPAVLAERLVALNALLPPPAAPEGV